MTFGIFITSGISILLGFTWIYMYGHLHELFGVVCQMYCVSCIIESMAEPYFVKPILTFEYSTIAKSEAFSIFSKTIILFLLTKLKFFHPLINFGISQISFSTLLLIAAVYFTRKTETNFKFEKIDNSNYYVESQMKEMGKQFTIISFLKLLLQEIEKLVLIQFKQDNTTSAEFQVVSNLGSMIPRYIYAPIEEVCYNAFSKIQVQDNEQQRKIMQQDLLQKVYKLINIIAFFVLIFGFPYAEALLSILYGQLWTKQSCILATQMYCLYEYAMGLNGISEAYMYGTISAQQLSSFRLIVMGTTGLYLILSLYFLQYGAWGLILANCLSMFVRVLVCFYFMWINLFDKSFQSQKLFLKNTFPNKKYIIAFLSTIPCSIYICNIFKSNELAQLSIGGAMAVSIGYFIFKQYKDEFSIILKKKETEI